MSEALQRLREIGAQKIYEDTHIPIGNVKAILNEDFESLTKVHFIGFVSILEREYGEDLTQLRNNGTAYFSEREAASHTITNETLFTTPEQRRNKQILYIVLAVVFLLAALVYKMQSSSDMPEKPFHENPVVKSVKNNIIPDLNKSENNKSESNSSAVAVEDSNTSALMQVDQEQNSTTEVKEQEPQEEVKAEPKASELSFKIVPIKKVWLGYIDVETHKRYQKVFSGELDLDPTKKWLLYFGHGYVSFVVNGEKESFHDRNKLRMYYDDGLLTKISLQEFKKLNRGRSW